MSFALTDRVLAAHRSGALLCLAPDAKGASFSMRSERPGTFGRVSVASFAASVTTEEAPDSEDGPLSSGASSSQAGGQVVAVVQVRGLLSSEVSSWDCGWSDGYAGDGGIVDQVRAALGDSDCIALVMDILSPGGDSLGCGEAAAQLAAMCGQADKPVLVYARKACSAAYWLGAAAAGDGGLFVSESSDVGNVGTWMCHADFSKANADEGVVYTYVADPPGKVLGNADEPLDPEGLARFKRSASETTTRFCAAVASARPALTAASLMELNGDTRRGAVAVAEGLADGMATSLEEVVALACSRALLARPPSVLTSSPSAPMKGHSPMPISSALLLAAGLDPKGSSDALAEASILPRLSLANTACELLGEADPVKARGKLAAKLEEAAAAGRLREQLGTLSAESDAAKRIRKVEWAVFTGRLRSGSAWAWSEGAKGERVRAFSTLMAKASAAHPELAAFESYLESLPVLYEKSLELSADTTTAEASAELRGLSPHVRSLAARAGVDPQQLALNHAALFGARSETA